MGRFSNIFKSVSPPKPVSVRPTAPKPSVPSGGSNLTSLAGLGAGGAALGMTFLNSGTSLAAGAITMEALPEVIGAVGDEVSGLLQENPLFAVVLAGGIAFFLLR